ncbi:GlsB/YeaQ/YmgE family stress response membrane protein [Nocardioides sp.]|uniref:GlsB/YeaQ/YmgE family stress response membrane protein n=1 Tax=Nocardioides sp. TaxID=35761 RepID=UPI00378451C6
MYLILGLILFGMVVGAIAQFILGREGGRIDWTRAIVAGIVGSFVGGLLLSLLAGDGLAFRPSGIIGSIIGALIVTALWRWLANRSEAA